MKGIVRCSPERLGPLAVLAAATLLVAGVAGASASTPTGGSLKFWATPTTSGADNLKTYALVMAAYPSAAEGNAVRPISA